MVSPLHLKVIFIIPDVLMFGNYNAKHHLAMKWCFAYSTTN